MDTQKPYNVRLQQLVFLTIGDLFDVANDELRNSVFGAESMTKYWIPAFTHFSVNPEYGKNYENLEYIGDKFVNAIFSMYVNNLAKSRGVELDEEARTLLLNDYMSKKFQAQKARDLKLADFVQYNSALPGVADDIAGDVFESFFGALIMVADELICPGTGYAYAYNLMRKILQDVNIDLNVKKPIVSQLKEIFDVKSWGDVVYTYAKSDRQGFKTKASVKLSNGQELGTGYGVDHDTAQIAAATEAMKYLATQGITHESVKAESANRIRLDPEYDVQYARVIKALQILSSQPGRAPIAEFKLESRKKIASPTGDILTFVLMALFQLPDGRQNWVDLKSAVGAPGQKATAVRIELMKNFADSLNVPN